MAFARITGKHKPETQQQDLMRLMKADHVSERSEIKTSLRKRRTDGLYDLSQDTDFIRYQRTLPATVLIRNYIMPPASMHTP